MKVEVKTATKGQTEQDSPVADGLPHEPLPQRLVRLRPGRRRDAPAHDARERRRLRHLVGEPRALHHDGQVELAAAAAVVPGVDGGRVVGRGGADVDVAAREGVLQDLQDGAVLLGGVLGVEEGVPVA